MPQGTICKARRMMAGLLVLTVLLFSAAQASVPMLPNSHHHGADMSHQVAMVANRGLATPASRHDNEHGLPCCVGAQCMTHAYWIVGDAGNLPNVSLTATILLWCSEASPPGVAQPPSSPPPRAAV